ncbi:MAG TPA: hypothetical protein VK541_13685 [Pedobacter sp.]|nr:hypothetical protein [Pedobacter sp.]HMI03536.1 hypothetical protein [Pedobacter sp.]
MDTLDNGPFGHLNGRVGNVVSYTCIFETYTGPTNHLPHKFSLLPY